jgi:flagellin-like hook-associated protein FlgL
VKRSVFFSILLFAFIRPLWADDSSLIFLNDVLNWREADTNKNMERLSGGRILLTDDPAGYAIDQALEKYVRGLDRTIANQTDMISYYRVEDAMFTGIIDILQRIKELALQRTDGILSDDDRDIIDMEIGQQYDEIGYVLSQAEFNTKKLFTDLMSSEAIVKNFGSPKYFELSNVDALLDFFISQRGKTGALMESLQFAAKGEAIASENMTAARTALDTDYASELSAFKQNQLLMLVNILMLPHGTQ